MQMSLDGFTTGPNEPPNNRSETTEAKPDHRPPREGETEGKDRPNSADVAQRGHAVAGPMDVPFKYRGWAVDFDAGPEADRFKLEEAQNAEALLLGRVTYEAMQAFWPTAQGEFAGRAEREEPGARAGTG
jgi:hypothetical protein